MPGKGRRIALWLVALVLMLAAAAWQRYSGPTYPARPSFTFAGESHRAKLVRSGTTGEPAVVTIPAPASAAGATLRWRRWPTEDPFADVEMTRADGEFRGELPSQPPAGKVEYDVVIRGEDGTSVNVPEGEEKILLRYKGHVPLWILLPHVLLMFLAVLFGLRTGLAAAFAPAEVRRLSLLTLGGMTLGGLVLGPITQKYAFGEYWTGFPFGYDLTDNKVLVLWLVWLLAVAVLWLGRRRAVAGRVAVGLAAVVMFGVYLIPHSLRGSELDYGKLEQVADPTDAIRTGRVDRP